MNLREANDLDIVLRYFLGIPLPGGTPMGDEELSDAVEEITASLADRAHQLWPSALTGDAVHAAWRHLELGPWVDDLSVPFVVDVPVKEGIL